MEKNLALKASAGSGKTFALSVRYISLLLLDVEPSTILTLTFTNKAAYEMSERIFKTLYNLGNDEIIIDEIIKQTNLTKESILEKKQVILQKFLSSELAILTLDKFMNKVLREFSGYLGLGEDFAILNNDHEYLLYKFLLTLDEEHFSTLIEFSHSFEAKLSGVVELFTLLDEKNENYQYYDFRQDVLDGFKDNVLSSAYKIKSVVESLGLSNSAIKGVEFSSIEELMKKTWLEKDGLEEYHYFKKAKEQIALHNATFEYLKEQLSYYINYKEQKDLNALFKIYNYYRAFRMGYKKEKNQLKFSDVTNLVYELLDRYVDKEFLYFRLDSRYEHIMIDEFQDTSTLQFKILQPLIEEILSGNVEKFKTFFYVGDTKQSIYRFRGGKKELFDYVLHQYKDDIKIDYLNTNYRSAFHVVDFTNEIFLKQNNYSYQAQLVQSEVKGFVGVETIKNDEVPYEDVKKQVEHLLHSGINPNNIAILTYTNADVLGVYEYLKFHFPKMKISTDMTSKLIEQKNVKTIINAIKYLYFKEDIYLATFNTLLGCALKEPLEYEKKLQTLSLKELIYDMASQYQLLDENVLKLIDIAESYSDIVEFVYEIGSDDSSMVSQESTGLQILTIFKSKGLEFDTVILLDRIKSKNNDRSRLLFSYDEVNLDRIFFKKKERSNFDTYYKNAIIHEEELSLDDELNILYVAITRAKYNLIILKKEKSSVFENFTFSIDGIKKGELFISAAKIYQQEENIKVEYTPVKIGYQEEQIKSSIMDDSENLKARYFGIATHYCLEMMDSFTKRSLDKAYAQTSSRYYQYLDETTLQNMYNRIVVLIESEVFQSLLTQSDFTKEQELIYNGELKIIDLLIERDEKFIVIDYKTTYDTNPKHFEQVRYYKQAINSITNKEVDGYLLYLKENEVLFQKV